MMKKMNPILSYLIRQLVRMAVIVAVVTTLAFVLTATAPLDPVTAYLGYDRMQISPEQQQLIIQRWGLDKPAPARFVSWAGHMLRGDFGHSVIYNEPVLTVVGKRFKASLLLMGLAWSLSGLVGFVLGGLAGTYRGSLLDNGVRMYAFMLAATPTFWIGMVLLALLSVKMGWFPICCATLFVVAGNAIADLLYQLVDPRIQPGEGVA
jgi:peptide/nickel transport system permease protein